MLNKRAKAQIFYCHKKELVKRICDCLCCCSCRAFTFDLPNRSKICATNFVDFIPLEICPFAGPSGGLPEAAEQLYDSAAAFFLGEPSACPALGLSCSCHVVDRHLKLWL